MKLEEDDEELADDEEGFDPEDYPDEEH